MSTFGDSDETLETFANKLYHPRSINQPVELISGNQVRNEIMALNRTEGAHNAQRETIASTLMRLNAILNDVLQAAQINTQDTLTHILAAYKQTGFNLTQLETNIIHFANTLAEKALCEEGWKSGASSEGDENKDFAYHWMNMTLNKTGISNIIPIISDNFDTKNPAKTQLKPS